MTTLLDLPDALAWRQPLWLLLLVVPVVLILWQRHQRSRPPSPQTPLARHIEPALLKKIVIGETKSHRSVWWLVAAMWVLAALAAAGPYLSQAKTEQSTLPGANVAIVVDISPSMSVADIPPDRIQQAKLQLIDFIRQLDNTRLALVTFSANAYAILPLTTDKETVIHFTDALDPSLVTVAGSNLERALKLAGEALDDPPPGSSKAPAGLVILISDGGIHDTGAWDEAARLKQAGHQLFSVGVGSEEGGPVPLMLGQLVRQGDRILTSTRQRQTLTSLATAGGGRYYDLSPEAWSELRQTINQLEQALYEDTPIKQQGPALYTGLILLIVAMLLLYGWRRAEVLMGMIIFPALLLSPSADASPWLEKQAMQALRQGEYQQAQQLYGQLSNYQGAFGLGVTAYRQQRWPQALSAFEQAYRLATNEHQKASSSYNQANTLAQLGRLSEAIEAYQRTLSHQPGHARANRNLALLKRAELTLGMRASQSDQPSVQPGPGTTNNESATDRSSSGSHPPQPGDNGREASPEDEKLKQSLRRWSQIKDATADVPTHAIQQLHNLKDDSTLMLRRRFSIEDERAIGLVEEKPW